MNAAPRSRLSRAPRVLRATFGALSAVGPRARRDARFLAAYLGLTAVIAGATLAAPVALARSADAGLRSAVASDGPAADVRISYAFPPGLAHPGGFLDRAVAAASAGVPDDLSDVARPVTAALRTTPAPVADGPGADPGDPLEIALAHARDAEVTWVSGTDPDLAPPASGKEPEVLLAGIARSVADATGLDVGDEFTLGREGRIPVRITGTFEPVRPDDGVWADLPGLLDLIPANDDAPPIASLLVARGSLPAMFDHGARTSAVAVRFAADPALLHPDVMDSTRRAVAEVVSARGALTIASNAPVPSVSTTLDDVLDAYQERLRTARAQATTVLVGLAVSGALVLVPAAGLLVRRRGDVLELERARGASVPAAIIAATAEASAVAVAAGTVAAAGLLAVAAALPGGLTDGFGDGTWWLPGVVVLLVAAAAPVVLTARAVAGAGSGRRVAANRSDRARTARLVAAWRGWAEAAVVLLAVLAVAGAWSRGLVPDGDLLLAAAPALVAAACTVVVLRVVPVGARAAARSASRGPALIGLVAASRVAGQAGDRGRRRRTASPAAAVLAVTMTSALAVSCAAAATTVRAAQEHAGDVVVGADVRIDRPSEEFAATALEPRPDVVAVAGSVFGQAAFGGDSELRATVLALDTARFEHLADLSGTDDGPPLAYLPPELSDVARHVPPEIYLDGTSVPLQVAGTRDAWEEGPFVSPTGTRGEPVIVLDRSALASALGVPESDLGVQVVWLSGDGAAAAAAELARGSTRPGETATVLTRADHERTLRGDALTQGLLTLYRAGAVAMLLLGAAAIALTVQATAADRVRVLAVLRTTGVPARATAWLPVVELAPALGAAVIAGLGSGVLVAALLTSAQGLGLLAGGGDPALRLDGWPFVAAIVVTAGVLGVMSWLEARSRRQIRIGEVLRTW